MTTKHIREALKLAPDPLVELYSLDTTALSNIYGTPGQGDVLYFCAGTIGSEPLRLGGITYVPWQIQASGFEWQGAGKLPRPKLQIANLNGLAGGLTYQYADLLGAVVTRIRTFARFLDGQADADPTATFEPDVFRIDRKSHQDKAYVEFELAASFDQQGVRLPRRQILRDSCSYTYRVRSSAGFVPGACPYTGSAMFDAFDIATNDPTKDSCSHKLTGCVARFGRTAPLPIAAFPGVAQTRAN